MSDKIKEARAKLLEMIMRDAYFREKIILSSGKESDYYIDARLVTLQPLGAYLTARLMLERVKDVDYDAIGGPTLGADPMIGAIGVISVVDRRERPCFIIRKAAKAHGKQKQVEGPLLERGARVVLIDDVATTGKAFLESLDVLEPMGIKVVRALCIVDRGEGAREALAKRGLELVSLFEIGEIHKKK